VAYSTPEFLVVLVKAKAQGCSLKLLVEKEVACPMQQYTSAVDTANLQNTLVAAFGTTSWSTRLR